MHTTLLPAESPAARVARNFFTHSGHVPLVILILEALLAHPGYFSQADPYLLLCAGLAQAWLMEWTRMRRHEHPFLSNLAGPMLYSIVETTIEGAGFLFQPHHQAYWGFALGFGALHSVRKRGATVIPSVVLAENILRSAIPLVMYALFEAQSNDARLSLVEFFSDSAHTFLAIVLLLLGVLLGFADIGLQHSLHRVSELTARLRQYSEWSLGRGILDRAIADERVLSLQRVERAILFMDIRGFTAWSEYQTPEAVAAMLTDYYRTADSVLADGNAIKVKYTADEVMAVFPDAKSAIEAGRDMLGAVNTATRRPLAASGLSAGCGIHCGTVVEGIMGSEGTRAYEVIGDTVNTAKRLCDAAGPDECLASNAACVAAGIDAEETREVFAKGKRDPVRAAVVAYAPAPHPAMTAKDLLLRDT